MYNISEVPELIQLANPGNLNIPATDYLHDHLQGICKSPKLVDGSPVYYLSGGGEKIGYLIVAHGTSMLRAVPVTQDPNAGLNHCGAIQVFGDHLLVPIERSTRGSVIQLWDISEPLQPKHIKALDIEDGFDKAAAVGATHDDKGNCWLITQHSPKALRWYKTKLPLGSAEWEWRIAYSFNHTAVDKDAWAPDQSWGDYQGGQTLLTQQDGQLFFVGFAQAPYRDKSARNGRRDYADIFVFNPEAQKMSERLVKVGQITIRPQGGTPGLLGFYEVQTGWGAGLSITSTGGIELFACERNLRAPTAINRFI